MLFGVILLAAKNSWASGDIPFTASDMPGIEKWVIVEGFLVPQFRADVFKILESDCLKAPFIATSMLAWEKPEAKDDLTQIVKKCSPGHLGKWLFSWRLREECERPYDFQSCLVKMKEKSGGITVQEKKYIEKIENILEQDSKIKSQNMLEKIGQLIKEKQTFKIKSFVEEVINKHPLWLLQQRFHHKKIGTDIQFIFEHWPIKEKESKTLFFQYLENFFSQGYLNKVAKNYPSLSERDGRLMMDSYQQGIKLFPFWYGTFGAVLSGIDQVAFFERSLLFQMRFYPETLPWPLLFYYPINLESRLFYKKRWQALLEKVLKSDSSLTREEGRLLLWLSHGGVDSMRKWLELPSEVPLMRFKRDLSYQLLINEPLSRDLLAYLMTLGDFNDDFFWPLFLTDPHAS
jgi:hypothetical protein